MQANESTPRNCLVGPVALRGCLGYLLGQFWITSVGCIRVVGAVDLCFTPVIGRRNRSQ
jgi:hypothetical protein